jgi:hypothetical protein
MKDECVRSECMKEKETKRKGSIGLEEYVDSGERDGVK